MQAKNLEELELQQPFVERTLRPLVARLSGRMQRMTSTSFSDTTERRLALAGNPGDMRVADWLGIKAVGAIVGAILFFLLFFIVNILEPAVLHQRPDDPGRRPVRLHRSRSSGWAGACKRASTRSC